MKKPLFNKVAIIGVGLIGGSLGLAIKKRRLAKLVIGVVRSDRTLKEAMRRRVIDTATKDLKGGIRGADLIILASRIFTINEQLKMLGRFIDPRALVIDVGSSKSVICQTAKHSIPPGQFIGCHPMAGSEKRGVEHADPNLFEESVCFMTKRNAKVYKFWKRVGATPVYLPQNYHDSWVAEASHLPHLLAFSKFLSRDTSRVFNLASSLRYLNPSFKSMVRLAKSDPELWTDILSSNNQAILSSLERFEGNLDQFKRALRIPDVQRRSHAILQLLVRVKQNSSAFPDEA